MPALLAVPELLFAPTYLLFLISVWALVGIPLGFLSVRRRTLEHWVYQLRTGGDFRAVPDYGLASRCGIVMLGSVYVVAVAVNWVSKAT